jgi:hypothetical protein
VTHHRRAGKRRLNWRVDHEEEMRIGLSFSLPPMLGKPIEVVAADRQNRSDIAANKARE